MQNILKLMGYMRPYWKQATIGPLMKLIEVMMELMQPRLVQRIVDEGIARGDLDLVIETGLWMLGLAIGGVLFGIGNAWFGVWVAQRVETDVRSALFGKIQSLSFGNLDKLSTGHLITRLTNDVRQVGEVARLILRILSRMPMAMVGGLVMAIVTSPRLGLDVYRAGARDSGDSDLSVPKSQCDVWRGAESPGSGESGDAGKFGRRARGEGFFEGRPRD